MIGHTLSDSAFTSVIPTGIITSTTASQGVGTSINVSWTYEGSDYDDNIYFLVYLNGRLVQRLAGSVRETSVIAFSYEKQDVVVVPHRKNMTIEQDIYGSARPLRGHLEWTAPADPTIAGYSIESSSTSSVGPFAAYADHSEVTLQTGIFSLGNGTIEVLGDYSVPDSYTNALFTVTVNADEESVTVTNDTDSFEVVMPFVTGVAFSAISGIVFVITEGFVATDSASFRIGVQPYYDTDALASGTTWFRVAPYDTAGNVAAWSSVIPITIDLPPDPLVDQSLYWSVPFSFYALIQFAATAEIGGGADSVNIYTNFDPTTNTLLDHVIFDAPFSSFPVDQGVPFESNLDPIPPFPAGTLMVVARAVNAAGIDDGTAVVHTISTTYSDPAMPTPHSITARPIAGGDYELVWHTDVLHNGYWVITGDFDLGGDFEIYTDTYEVEPSGPYFKYTYTVDVTAFFPSDGHLTGTIAASPELDGFGIGVAGTYDVTIDSTAPSAITTITGVGF